LRLYEENLREIAAEEKCLLITWYYAVRSVTLLNISVHEIACDVVVLPQIGRNTVLDAKKKNRLGVLDNT
jgi:hypothetical protein